MFYNALIQAFLNDESLFTDVKAIVDCPLRVDPSEVIRACREGNPRDILELLDAPGSDLEHPILVVPDEARYGRDGFLKDFGERDKTKHVIQRRRTFTTNDPFDVDVDPVPLQRPRSSLTVGNFNPGQGDLPRLSVTPSTVVDKTEAQLLQMAATRARTRMDPADLSQEARTNLRRSTATNVWAQRVDNLVEQYKAEKADAASASHSVITEMTKVAITSKYHLRVQRLGEELIQSWPRFYRRTSSSWAPDRNSLIPVPKPFVVPGGRFIEIYYWDSYWIIRGLLSSGLEEVARGIIENFLFCIERFGFIPNGLRKYYLDRSQPPLLSCMLRAFYHATQDRDFVQGALQMLEREYAFWMSPRLGHLVELELPDRSNHGHFKKCHLNRYYSLETTPRPESYRIDEITATLYREFNGAADSIQEHYRAIRAAAEAGWDFSSRWLRPAVEGEGEGGIKPDMKIDKVLHKVCLVDIDTCTIIPCDLNAFLFCLEEDLAYFAGILGKTDSEQVYLEAREQRREAMLHFLWDHEREMWLDYDLKRRRFSSVLSAASFVPLWAGVNPEKLSDQRRIELASRLSGIVRPYGIVCTNITAGLQWDNPNVWAPNHHIAVDFLCGGRFWELEKSAMDDQGPAMALGINWASRFVNTVLDRFEFFGTCSEKYDCNRLGKSGVDGEYVTQDGFGWTNGAVLDFMEKFRNRLTPQGLYSAKRPGDSFSGWGDIF
eukprot:Gregarina_sp_Poly_1__7626@NODE_428_length_8567_cov_88_085529_g349_i0_p1_GENE_NODE_428_length_8567_cov_88_085529_g349_i0NODE_428_length_8567_cov_88_085529_g349_i0_p1_ORF_typecomplete_len719_score84_14Trehalase/PF01204_18/2_6e82GDE_C/PF06202_14/2_3e03GDE_C/PF06202_14/5_1e05Bac_rhamnosid6H/PF17389_2/56Bac_rhamnosid6H/PF17389_2/0_0022_NODE_428_length_8567_cov_88_085529_g349_i045506706